MIEFSKAATDKDEYNALLFVLKALSTDETRPFLMVLHVEKRRGGIRVVATDGRRLHMADLVLGIEPGDYTSLVTKMSIILKPNSEVAFPNWRRVVPQTGAELGTLDFSAASVGKKVGPCGQMTRAVVSLVEKTHEVINVHYLDDLSKAPWTIFGTSGSSRAVLLRRGNIDHGQTAVIMPLENAA